MADSTGTATAAPQTWEHWSEHVRVKVEHVLGNARDAGENIIVSKKAKKVFFTLSKMLEAAHFGAQAMTPTLHALAEAAAKIVDEYDTSYWSLSLSESESLTRKREQLEAIEVLLERHTARLGAVMKQSGGALSVLLENVQVKKWWDSSFGEAELVPWADFWAQWAVRFPTFVSERDQVSLRALLDQCRDGRVTPYELNVFVQWFHPFDQAMELMHTVMGKSWFHGFSSSRQVETLLKGKQRLTYIVRFSRSVPGSFALAVVNSGVVRHTLVTPGRGGTGYDVKVKPGAPPDHFPRLQDVLQRKDLCGQPFRDLTQDVEEVDDVSAYTAASAGESGLFGEENEEMPVCKICMDNTCDCALVPCGHASVCYDCSAKLKECPFCRCPLHGALKLYF